MEFRRRAPRNDTYICKDFQTLEYEFHVDQKHEMEIRRLFDFPKEESTAPLDIPIPTPAPDQGGPVATFAPNHNTIRQLFKNNLLAELLVLITGSAIRKEGTDNTQ